MTPHTPRCIARHTGLWLADTRWLMPTWAAIRAGGYRMFDTEEAELRSLPVVTTEDGIGIIGINGPVMKGASKFGNTDTLEVRHAVRSMAADSNIRGMVLAIDSPGGTFAGTDDLYHDVTNAARAKPVYAQFQGLGASAAYYLAAGSTAMFAGPADEVGSIGMYAVVEDSSKAAEMDGIKVYVVSTGGVKGAFVDGAPVTEPQLAMLQENVNQANGFFQAAVKRGRGLTDKRLEAVSDGRTWFGAEAQSLGLIDGVQRLEDTIAQVRSDLKAKSRIAQNQRRVAIAKARV